MLSRRGKGQGRRHLILMVRSKGQRLHSKALRGGQTPSKRCTDYAATHPGGFVNVHTSARKDLRKTLRREVPVASHRQVRSGGNILFYHSHPQHGAFFQSVGTSTPQSRSSLEASGSAAILIELQGEPHAMPKVRSKEQEHWFHSKAYRGHTPRTQVMQTTPLNAR